MNGTSRQSSDTALPEARRRAPGVGQALAALLGALVLAAGSVGGPFHRGEAGPAVAWAEPLEGADRGAPRHPELMELAEERMKQAQQKELQAQEAQRQMELLKADIDARIEQLRKERQELAKLEQERKERDEANLVLLAKSLAETPPEQAGVILGELEANLAASILKRMNNRKAGKIWGHIEADKAAAISRALANTSNGHEAKRPRARRKPPQLMPPPLPFE